MPISNALTNQPPLFSEMEGVVASSPAPVKSARSRNRAAWWQQDLDRPALYLMGQARTEDEHTFVEQLYEQAVEEFSKVAALIIPSPFPEAMALRDAARRRRFEESESSTRVA